MRLDDSARAFIGKGADATLVTINPDGSPQVSLVWVALQSTPDGDELVSAHLSEYQKTRNIRRDPRVALTIVSKATRDSRPRTCPSRGRRGSSRAARPNCSPSWPR